MNQASNWRKYHFTAFIIAVKISVLFIGAFFFAFGCSTNYESTYIVAVQNENYVGAKQLIQEQIQKDSFQYPKEPGRAKAYYRLAYVHGKLSEYDSMKIALESCLAQDGNFTKSKREMIEYFSLDEFNQAVFFYNNFFFDKAIGKLKTAVHIVGIGTPYEEYSAVIYRCLAYAEASNRNPEQALDYCKKASQLGDALSRKVLEEWEKEKKISPPIKLEPREKPILAI